MGFHRYVNVDSQVKHRVFRLNAAFENRKIAFILIDSEKSNESESR